MSIDKWTLENSFDRKLGSTSTPQWPHEMLVKVFSSKAYSKLTHDIIPLNNTINVMEIGCMGANNLRFFNEKGCNVFGCEVTEELVDLARLRCNEYLNKDVVILKGNNRSIPFADESMDVLVSVNTLHYDHNSENINSALSNFSRVLKKGGVAYIETAAPEHFICKHATRLNNLCFKSNYEDFRKGDLFGFFESSNQFKSMLQHHFSNVEILTLTEQYQNITLQFFVGIVKK